jgi:folate-dependent phosphoribosylglycinamide formyltransferase PurN|tara:strand:+ start:1069 stop:1629 length:561 start_codon:yes stop_codon:yes gene_type:complete
MKYKNWIALFSQTGQEIIDISNQIDRIPDLIISNNHPSNVFNILKGVEYKWLTTFGKEAKSLDILDEVVKEPKDTLITLNGWLRIVPPDKCSKYNIYNGHPGLITKYPELKGKDPQKRIWDDMHKYDTIGSVVHKVVEEVDAGEIATLSEVSSANLLSLDDVYEALRSTSLGSWCSFLKEHLYNKV